MELKFNNLNEIIDFLREIGYNVEKNICCGCKDKEDTLTIGEKSIKKEINDNDWWKNPYQPYYPFTAPTYPYSPITVFDAQNDPELSKKFTMKNDNIGVTAFTEADGIQLKK